MVFLYASLRELLLCPPAVKKSGFPLSNRTQQEPCSPRLARGCQQAIVER